EPRVVLVLAGVLTESDYLRRSSLACDIKSSHLNARRCAALVHHLPHALNHRLIDRLRNRNDLWIGTFFIEWLEGNGRMIIRRSRITDGFDFLQHMRNVQTSIHADTGNRPQQCNWRDDVVDLSERGVHRIDVAPVRIAW